MKLKLFIAAIFILTAGMIIKRDDHPAVTVYYVAAAGSSGNSGTTTAAPWNMSKAATEINAGHIHAGDRILFKKGDVFTGQWVCGFGGSVQSGTLGNPIYVGSYGSGAKPRFQTNTNQATFYMVGVEYWEWHDLNFEDITFDINDKWNIAPMAAGFKIGDFGGTKSNNNKVISCDFKNIGLGVILTGDYNLVDSCSFINLKNVHNTPGVYDFDHYPDSYVHEDDDDYGSNPLTVTGDYNIVMHCLMDGGWSESYDFGWNGGAFEMFGPCHNNMFLFNRINDCNGICEFGALDPDSGSDGNLVACNIITNCGSVFYVSFNNTFTTTTVNSKFFNNVFVEDIHSRYSGDSVGKGLHNDTALAHYVTDKGPFQFSGGSPDDTIYIFKNNIFVMSQPDQSITTRSEIADKSIHENNLLKLSGGSTPGYTLNPSEKTTAVQIFISESGDPFNFNFHLRPGSPAKGIGQVIGEVIKDYDGVDWFGVRNAGPFTTADASEPPTGPHSFLLYYKNFQRWILKQHGTN